MSTTKTYLAGDTFYLDLSVNNFTDTYTLVCLRRQGMKRQLERRTQTSQCGVNKAHGEWDRTLDVEAFNNLTPDALVSNVGEASYKLIAQWAEAKTTVYFERKSPADGSYLYQSGTAKIINLDDEEPSDENMSFSFTLDILTIDETP